MIKFRAWYKEGNRMILPKYLHSIDLLKEQVTERTKCKYTFSLHSIPFDKVELLQSTGLKDKNGKEIFEGDVVRQVRTQPTKENETITGVVTMLEGAWSIVNDNKQLASVLWSETAENEIIGNIYENPELLEDK